MAFLRIFFLPSSFSCPIGFYKKKTLAVHLNARETVTVARKPGVLVLCYAQPCPIEHVHVYLRCCAAVERANRGLQVERSTVPVVAGFFEIPYAHLNPVPRGANSWPSSPRSGLRPAISSADARHTRYVHTRAH